MRTPAVICLECRTGVYPSSYTAEFNERFRGNISDHPFRWLGASYLLRSYYDGDLKDTSLEIKTNRMALLLPQILLSIILERLQTNLGNEDFAYVSEETYKLQLAGQLSQPCVDY